MNYLKPQSAMHAGICTPIWTTVAVAQEQTRPALSTPMRARPTSPFNAKVVSISSRNLIEKASSILTPT